MYKQLVLVCYLWILKSLISNFKCFLIFKIIKNIDKYIVLSHTNDIFLFNSLPFFLPFSTVRHLMSIRVGTHCLTLSAGWRQAFTMGHVWYWLRKGLGLFAEIPFIPRTLSIFIWWILCFMKWFFSINLYHKFSFWAFHMVSYIG